MLRSCENIFEQFIEDLNGKQIYYIRMAPIYFSALGNMF